MSKTKQTPVEIVKGKAPERKCNITPIYMARYISNFGTDDDKAWFKKLRADNATADNPYYGFDVKKVREAFIAKYFPNDYKQHGPKGRKEELDDIMKDW